MFNQTVAKRLPISPMLSIHTMILKKVFSVMINMLRRQICDEVKEAGCFAVIVDENKKERAFVCAIVSYLHNKTMIEAFLDFTPAEGLHVDSEKPID